MDTMIIIIGLSLCLVGFLVKANPGMVCGYRSLSEERKRNVDIAGLTAFLRKAFFAMGIILLTVYFLFQEAGWHMLSEIVPAFILFPGFIIIPILSRRYDHNEKKQPSYLVPALFGIFAVLIAILFIDGYTPAKIDIDNNSVRFSGIYGTKISFEKIESVEVSEKISRTISKINGFGTPIIKKGFFKLEGYGKCRLFAQVEDRGPFLILTDKKGFRTIYKTPDQELAESYYRRIAHSLTDRKDSIR